MLSLVLSSNFSAPSSSSSSSLSQSHSQYLLTGSQHQLLQQQRSLPFSSFISRNPLKLNNHNQKMMKKTRSSFGAVCSSSYLSPENLQWVCTVASAVLMIVKGTAVQKTFLVPLLCLQAPNAIVSWIKGEYGTWTIFLALLVRLFYFIPGELELPLVTALLLIAAPNQMINLRGTQAGAIVSLVIAGFLAFQHFSRLGGWQKAFEQGSAIATAAVICITVVPGLLLI